VAPANDPWREISARIGAISRGGAATRHGTPLWPFAIAATVLLMAATMLISGQPWNPSRSFPAIQELAQRYPGAVASAASEVEYLAAFKEFMDRTTRGSRQRYLADFDAVNRLAPAKLN
jgi:hypothetical protein